MELLRRDGFVLCSREATRRLSRTALFSPIAFGRLGLRLGRVFELCFKFAEPG